MVIVHLKRHISTGGQESQLRCDDTAEKIRSTQIPDHRHREFESSHESEIVIERRLYPQHRGQDDIERSGSPLKRSPRNNRHLNIGDRPRRFCSAENIAYLIFFILLIIYAALQIIMATIHFDIGPTSNNFNNDNMSSHSVDHNAVQVGIWWSKVKQLTRFAACIVDLIPSPTNNPLQQSEDGYVLIFQILLAINIAALVPTIYTRVLLHWDQSQNPSENNEEKQRHIIHNNLLYKIYLPAYLLATCADWLQGPYKYALYSSYGYTQKDIAHLFVAGYGSGMVLGSLVGGLADQYGRKKLCLCYCLCYMFSVSMKHFKNFNLLLLGRVGGGIATSLLFSVFESWLIGAHIEKGLTSSGNKTNDKDEEEKWLAKSFSYSTYGSSLVAIGAGVLANLVVENSGQMRPLALGGNNIYVGGYIAAFDACLVPLVLCAVLIICLWDENFGGGMTSNTHRDEEIAEHVELVVIQRHDSGIAKKHSSVLLNEDEQIEVKEKSSEYPQSSSAKVGLLSGIFTVWNSPQILSICIIASAFEGSMYIFIFLWTPALTHIETQLKPTADDLPFGWIFASFMLCCLLGTISFSRFSRAGISASKCLVGILALAALSCLAMAYPHISGSRGAFCVQYWGMLTNEFVIGAYYPAMSVLKGQLVPEDQRAAIYNVFRLPLNLLVLINLTAGFSTQFSFLANAILLIMACILQIRLVGRTATMK